MFSKKSAGLLVVGSDDPIPLKSIHYRTDIVNGIADTVLTQTYFNPTDSFLETEYLLPLSEKVCFTGFKAIYEGKEILGVVKKKEAAKKEYEELKERGERSRGRLFRYE